jgi:hypothetical protein
MQIDFSDIIDKHKGKTAFVIANGPSTREYLDIFKKVSKEKDKYCVFVCNEVDQMLLKVDLSLIDDINPDYWVLANSMMRVENSYNSLNLLNKNSGTLLYANSVDHSDKNIVNNVLKIKYLPYDQRHFNKKKCDSTKECCNRLSDLIPTRLTIQEELQNYTNNKIHYGTGSTVALHMLAFSIISGCKKIYLSGIDLNYSLGYFASGFYNPDTFNPWIKEILDDFKIIFDSVLLLNDVEVINLSNLSPLKNIFKTSNDIIL